MKKLIILIILLIMSLTFLLSGCIEIDISTGIDPNFTSYLSYNITMDISRFEQSYQEVLKNTLNRIGWYYQEELGFAVDLHLNTDPISLTMTRRVTNDNFEQAYASLKSMLTDEDMTPFMQVNMDYQSFDRQNRYFFGATTDFPQIMRLSNTDELPPTLYQYLDDAIMSGKGNITISFPASEAINSSHRSDIQNSQAIMIVPLSYTNQTELEFTGVLNLLRDGSPGGTFNEIINEQVRIRNLAVIVSCAVAGLLLITIISAIAIGKKRRRENDGLLK